MQIRQFGALALNQKRWPFPKLSFPVWVRELMPLRNRQSRSCSVRERSASIPAGALQLVGLSRVPTETGRQSSVYASAAAEFA
jgi:hypothetical protein